MEYCIMPVEDCNERMDKIDVDLSLFLDVGQSDLKHEVIGQNADLKGKKRASETIIHAVIFQYLKPKKQADDSEQQNAPFLGPVEGPSTEKFRIG